MINREALQAKINSDPVIRILAIWHLSEIDENRTDERIIDTNLLATLGLTYPAERATRSQTKTTFLSLIASLPANTSEERVIKSNIEGSLYFLRALDGEKIPLEEYVRYVSGIHPAEFTEAEIEEQKQNVVQTRKLLHEDANHALNPFEVEKSFRDFLDEQIPKFLQFLGFPELEPKFQLGFESLDKAQLARADTDDEGAIHFTVNTHKRHKWTDGKAKSVALHEVLGHIVQDNAWQYQIMQGKLAPALGISMMFTPLMYLMEGIANSFPYFLPADVDPRTPAISYDLELSHLRRMVQYNAQIRANHDISLLENLIIYVKNNLTGYLDEDDPGLKPDVIRKRIEEGVYNPLSRSYSLVYAQSEAFLRRLAAECTRDEKTAFIRDVYRHPYIADDLHQWLQNYRNAN